MRKADPNDFWGKAPENLANINWRRLVTTLTGVIVIVVVLLLVFTGFYTVKSSERGVVRRFGKVVAETQPGLHFKWPWPIEVVDTPQVEEVKRIELGFRTIPRTLPAQYRDIPEEALMLTGDTNIVDLDMIVQYRISNAKKYLFNVRDVDGTVKDAAESAVRQVVGDSEIDDILTVGKTRAAQETHKIIQEICDLYGCGVNIVTVQLQDVYPPKEVLAAFSAVNSAREERSRMINEAEGYRERVVPEAHGRSEKMIIEAQGYRQERIARSQGDAKRFRSLLIEYEKAPDVTRERLYIETMEKVLPKMKKFIVEKDEGTLLKLLPLQEGALPR